MKIRLDQLVFDKGLAESRTKAQALIMAGLVLIDEKVVDKAGLQVDEEADIELKEKFPYVSRGALKLEKAAQEFGIDFKDKVVVDIGSSTGGFTDFVLQNGAKKVFAVDVGRGQLDQKLRQDPRVVVMEQTDFRAIESCASSSSSLAARFAESRRANQGSSPGIPDNIDLFVCDVSFISLKRIIPKIAELIENSAESILLIKPQFEVGKKEADRGKGVIKDLELHQKVIEEIQDFSAENGFTIKGLTTSPITGAKGNVEYLLYLDKK